MSAQFNMQQRTTQQLLTVLREAHDYLPEAVEKADEELRRRGVNGFDIASAIDSGQDFQWQMMRTEEIPLSRRELLFWLLLPFLGLTPLGPRQYRKFADAGFRRKSLQLLETVFIGCSLYLLALMLLLPSLRG